MQTVLPREEAVEAVISKVLGSQEACDRLNEVFYEHLENYQEINDDGDRHFAEVLLQSYKNGDVSALLLELCGGSMFDLLRDAYLIPKKFHGKAGENPVPEGNGSDLKLPYLIYYTISARVCKRKPRKPAGSLLFVSFAK